MALRLHPREMPVQRASADLRQAVCDWRDRHDLTEAETLAVLTEVLGGSIGSIAKYAIREERHGDPDKPGGLE